MRAARVRRSHALDEQMEEDHAPGASTLNSSILLPGPDDENSSSSESDKSSDEDYTQEDANAAYQRWLSTLDREVVKIMAMMISDNYVVRFGLTKTNAAKEVALLLGLNKKTVRTWRQDFSINKGQFSEYKRGTYARYVILRDEEYTSLALECMGSS